MSTALRSIPQEKTRLTLSVAGVALAAMLIPILSGFEQGLHAQITSCRDCAPGSVVVLRKGVTNSLGATSLRPKMPAAARTRGQ